MEQLQNLSLNETFYNPGTVLTEKNNDTEYILLGYDQTRNNLICLSKINEHILNNNVYVINKNNIDKIIKNDD